MAPAESGPLDKTLNYLRNPEQSTLADVDYGFMETQWRRNRAKISPTSYYTL
jgi:hypothetical protein